MSDPALVVLQIVVCLVARWLVPEGSTLEFMMSLGVVLGVIKGVVVVREHREAASRNAARRPQSRSQALPADELPDDANDPFAEGHHAGLGTSAAQYADNQRKDD